MPSDFEESRAKRVREEDYNEDIYMGDISTEESDEEEGSIEDFHDAIYESDYDSVTRFIEAGMDCNATDEAGNNALHAAIEAEDFQLVDMIIPHVSADSIEALNNDGYTPMALAVTGENDKIDIVRLLLDEGANLEGKRNDITYLMMTSIRGSEEILKFLISNNADIEATNNEGETALIMACKRGYTNTAKILLKSGASKVDIANAVLWSEQEDNFRNNDDTTIFANAADLYKEKEQGNLSQEDYIFRISDIVKGFEEDYGSDDGISINLIGE